MKFIKKLVSRADNVRKNIGAFFQTLQARIKQRLSPAKPAYRLTHNAKENYQICTFCVSEPLLDGEECVLSFRNSRAQREKQTPLVADLFAIKGVAFVELVDYEIRVGKADVYHWSELIKATEAVVRRHLADMVGNRRPVGATARMSSVGLN